jgi:hypothetical protein
MHRLTVAFALFLAVAVLSSAPPAAAQVPPLGDPSQGMVPVSQIIRQAGYTLTDAEAAYLDAEQQLQGQYLTPFVQVVTLAGTEGVPVDSTRTNIMAELQKVTNLDPSAAPEAPASLQRLRELTIQQRVGMRAVAQQWLDGLIAGDPDWRQRGASDFQAAQQSLSDWQQELANRFPPPTQP